MAGSRLPIEHHDYVKIRTQTFQDPAQMYGHSIALPLPEAEKGFRFPYKKEMGTSPEMLL